LIPHSIHTLLHSLWFHFDIIHIHSFLILLHSLLIHLHSVHCCCSIHLHSSLMLHFIHSFIYSFVTFIHSFTTFIHLFVVVHWYSVFIVIHSIHWLFYSLMMMMIFILFIHYHSLLVFIYSFVVIHCYWYYSLFIYIFCPHLFWYYCWWWYIVPFCYSYSVMTDDDLLCCPTFDGIPPLWYIPFSLYSYIPYMICWSIPHVISICSLIRPSLSPSFGYPHSILQVRLHSGVTCILYYICCIVDVMILIIYISFYIYTFCCYAFISFICICSICIHLPHIHSFSHTFHSFHSASSAILFLIYSFIHCCCTFSSIHFIHSFGIDHWCWPHCYSVVDVAIPHTLPLYIWYSLSVDTWSFIRSIFYIDDDDTIAHCDDDDIDMMTSFIHSLLIPHCYSYHSLLFIITTPTFIPLITFICYIYSHSMTHCHCIHHSTFPFLFDTFHTFLPHFPLFDLLHLARTFLLAVYIQFVGSFLRSFRSFTGFWLTSFPFSMSLIPFISFPLYIHSYILPHFIHWHYSHSFLIHSVVVTFDIHLFIRHSFHFYHSHCPHSYYDTFTTYIYFHSTFLHFIYLWLPFVPSSFSILAIPFIYHLWPLGIVSYIRCIPFVVVVVAFHCHSVCCYIHSYDASDAVFDTFMFLSRRYIHIHSICSPFLDPIRYILHLPHRYIPIHSLFCCSYYIYIVIVDTDRHCCIWYICCCTLFDVIDLFIRYIHWCIVDSFIHLLFILLILLFCSFISHLIFDTFICLIWYIPSCDTISFDFIHLFHLLFICLIHSSVHSFSFDDCWFTVHFSFIHSILILISFIHSFGDPPHTFIFWYIHSSIPIHYICYSKSLLFIRHILFVHLLLMLSFIRYIPFICYSIYSFIWWPHKSFLFDIHSHTLHLFIGIPGDFIPILVFHSLSDHCDIVIHSFSPHSITHFGIWYIHCSFVIRCWHSDVRYIAIPFWHSHLFYLRWYSTVTDHLFFTFCLIIFSFLHFTDTRSFIHYLIYLIHYLDDTLFIYISTFLVVLHCCSFLSCSIFIHLFIWFVVV